MQKKKQKKKAHRRAQRFVERAWAAVEEDRLELALREIDRALGERQDNPVIWNDYGLILEMTGNAAEAEQAFRNAILIAPGYAEAYASCARIVARRGRVDRARRLIRQALVLEPRSSAFQEQLEVYALLSPESDGESEPVRAKGAIPARDSAFPDDLRLERYDWAQIADELAARGCCVLPGLLTPEACGALLDLGADDRQFEKTVDLAGPTGHGGSYRFFRRPLPDLVAGLRSEIYARLVSIVNDWQERLGKPERFPAPHAEFQRSCEAARQIRPAAILLHYSAPAVNGLHRDLWGRVAFPLQLAVTLSPRAGPGGEAVEGGHFVLADEGPGRRARRRELVSDQGDAVVFCTSHRPVRVGGALGLQSVAHGMTSLTSGERDVLGCPFHDYK